MTNGTEVREDMRALARRAWWVFLIGGIASVLFGGLALWWPGVTLFVLALFFGASVLVDGFFNVMAAFQSRSQARSWWVLLLLGLLGVVVGVWALGNPVLTAFVLLVLIAAQAIVGGVLLVWAGVRLRKEITGEWLLILTGVLSVLFGIAIVAYPVKGLLAIVWLIATWAIVVGVLKVILAFKLKGAGARRAVA